LVASVAAQQTEPPATRWCKAFIKSCGDATQSVCGANSHGQYNCKSSFNANVCQSYEVLCNCTPSTGGSAKSASQVALISTFQLTNGACQNVPMRPDTTTNVATVATTSTATTTAVAPPPLTAGPTTTTTGSTTTPTVSGGSNLAGSAKKSQWMMAAVAAGAAAAAAFVL
ncbi:hypothetical protein BG004_007760, partial [Podila humilis]